MKTLKTLAALFASLFVFSAANAGEMTVSGTMQATYQSEVDDVTGNPLGLNTDLAFTGTTEVLGGVGVTWTMGTDGAFLGDTSADHKLAFATSYGTFQVGNSDDAANNVDDITPSAFEEANGSGSGTYTTDFGGSNEGSMSVGYRNADFFGTGINVSLNYYPKLDATTNNEKVSSANASGSAKSATTAAVSTTLANVPVIGSTALGGLKVTLGYEQSDSTAVGIDNKEGGTVALNYAAGPLSLGYQKKAYQALATSVGNDTFYKDDVYGIAYAVNDEFAVSYNVYNSAKHTGLGTTIEQETKAINVAYTVGGLTIAAQDAKTSNAAYTANSDDDTRTISIKTAF